MFKRLLCISFICLFGGINAKAQEVEVKAILDSTYLLIGSQMNISLEVDQPADVQVQFPNFVDTLTRSIEIVDASDPDTSLTDDRRSHIVRRLTVTSFDSGYHIIPPLPFFVKNNNFDGIFLFIVLKLIIYYLKIF